MLHAAESTNTDIGNHYSLKTLYGEGLELQMKICIKKYKIEKNEQKKSGAFVVGWDSSKCNIKKAPSQVLIVEKKGSKFLTLKFHSDESTLLLI